MLKSQLQPTAYNSYYARYLDLLHPKINIREAFKSSGNEVLSFFNSIPKDKEEYKYEKGKWSIKEVFQHIIDTERIFAHRCFRIARKDKSYLTGFDQNIYIEQSKANDKKMKDLLEEYQITRMFTNSIVNSLSDEDLQILGNASGGVMSAAAAAFIILGHEQWHINIIKDRYLKI
jgi:uncharacterized damage-inducible protein DinB